MGQTVIIGALGYFIIPTDAVPDFIAIFGFTDDLWTLGAALGIVAVHVKPTHKESAKEKMKIWFG